MTTTTAPDGPTSAEIADLLAEAEAHLERVGHHKGWLYDEKRADEREPLTDIPVCAVGAVLAAAYGEPRYPSKDPLQSTLTDAAITALTATVGQPIPLWNDAKGRQKRQVTKAFRDTIAGLRAEAAA